jgi:hypothetical protein
MGSRPRLGFQPAWQLMQQCSEPDVNGFSHFPGCCLLSVAGAVRSDWLGGQMTASGVSAIDFGPVNYM